MITDKQKQLLESLVSPSGIHYSEEDYDIMGIYGHNYKQISEDYDDYYEDEEDDEEVPY